MDWVNATFPKKYAALRATVWEKGFKAGYSEVSPEIVAWLDMAHEAYYKRRIYTLLAQVETQSSQVVQKQWEDLVVEICGDVQALKDDLYKAIFADDKISLAAKNWLKKTYLS